MVELWHIEKGNNARDVGVKTRSFQANSARIKGMAICNDVLFTGDSSGVVKGHTKKGKCIFEKQTDARITCLTVTDVNDNTENGEDEQRVVEGAIEDIKKSKVSLPSRLELISTFPQRRSRENNKKRKSRGNTKSRDDRG